ncbi:hypothetical protein LB503_001698 [Fusarium chuoi]|nr:hypothetical protein LB503_001698 [Fusarium chuoi]
MTAPRLLQKPSLSINRPAIFLIHRTDISAVSRRRTFSQCQYRPQQHSERELQERLQAARPLVPHHAARKFTQAGSSRRRRFNFLSDSMVARAHSKAAAQVIEQVRAQGGHFLSEWDPRTILVRRVMRKLIPVSGMADLNWEIFVIADNRTANAFVLPGGKVFVHSGIINVCRSEDALAAVLGHEIAHNTASHAAERLSAAWPEACSSSLELCPVLHSLDSGMSWEDITYKIYYSTFPWVESRRARQTTSA